MAWILMANKHVADYDSYRLIFEDTSDFRDWGFGALCLLFNKMGYTVLDLKMVTTAISYIILIWLCNKYIYYKAFAAALYLLFFNQLDVVQFRNFIAISFFLLGLGFLIQDKKYSKVKYLICIIIGSLFHSMVIFYTILLVFNKRLFKSPSKLLSISIPFVLAMSIILLSSPSQLTARIDTYSAGSSLLTKIVVCIIYIINIVSLKYMAVNKNVLRVGDRQTALLQNDTNAIMYLNYGLLFILPLAVNNLIYMRLFRFVGLVNCFYFLNTIYYKKHKTLYFLLIIIYATIYLIIVYFMHSDAFFDGIMNPLYNQNEYITL